MAGPLLCETTHDASYGRYSRAEQARQKPATGLQKVQSVSPVMPKVGQRADVTALHVVYRSYGGENSKGRPLYYSKFLALVSMMRALESAGRPVEVVFLNDGPVPAHRTRAMESIGEVLPLTRRGNKRSSLAALALPTRRRWPAPDLVWFAEDDYLYQPNAFAQLCDAADEAPWADYLGLYGLIGTRPPEGGRVPDWLLVPKQLPTTRSMLVHGHEWRVALATTSTFGARVDVIKADRWLHALSMATATAWDYTASLAYQGLLPFPWRRITAGPRPGDTGRHRAKVCVAVPARMAVNLLAVGQRRRRRILLASDPALCTHMETAHLASGSDWSKVANETAAWAAARNLKLTSGR